MTPSADERRERIAALATSLRLHARELIDGGTNASELRKHLFEAADLLASASPASPAPDEFGPDTPAVVLAHFGAPGEVSREPDATLREALRELRKHGHAMIAAFEDKGQDEISLNTFLDVTAAFKAALVKAGAHFAAPPPSGAGRRPEPSVTAHELLAALKALADGMDRRGGDRDGMPECPWCKAGPDGDDHAGDCELAFARVAIADAEAALAEPAGRRPEPSEEVK